MVLDFFLPMLSHRGLTNELNLPEAEHHGLVIERRNLRAAFRLFPTKSLVKVMP